jgi:hypothetical protein
MTGDSLFIHVVAWLTSFIASYAAMFWIAYISAKHTIGG